MHIASETARLKSILGQLPQPHTVLELGGGDNPAALLHYAAASNIQLVGLDADAVALRTIHNPTISLIQADVTYLPFRNRFDLIVARHPDVDRHPAAWHQALIHAPEYLNSNGLLLITTYSLPEIETVDSWMSSLALVSLAPENLTPPGLQGCDRFLRMWRNLSSTWNV